MKLHVCSRLSPESEVPQWRDETVGVERGRAVARQVVLIRRCAKFRSRFTQPQSQIRGWGDRRWRRNFLYLSRSTLEELCRRRRPVTQLAVLLLLFAFLLLLLLSASASLLHFNSRSLPAESGVIDGLVHTLDGVTGQAARRELPLGAGQPRQPRHSAT